MNRCPIQNALVFLAAAILVSCSTSPDHNVIAPPPPPVNPCATSVPLPSSSAPIVCVDDRDLNHVATSPYRVWAKKNARVNWYTVTGTGQIDIAFEDGQCVNNVDLNCSGSQCDAPVKGPGGIGTSCKYTVKVKRGGSEGSEDPIVIIDA